MSIRREVFPFIIASIVLAAPIAALCCPCAGGTLAIVAIAYFLWFFRDPDRTPPDDPNLILAGADGTIARIQDINPDEFKTIASFCGLDDDQIALFTKPSVKRVSIFLSLFSVHVNRAPIAGESRFLGYFPGEHLFTFTEKSSDVNQHNSILITNASTSCLINQIVGPLCRRVVYWPDPDNAVTLEIGDRIGMMKFGSRLDMYFPGDDVEITAKVGDKTAAGETPIATLRKEKE
ncbi:phosphatidylserine decarboxylase [Verrucomicrobiota bacterium]